MNRLAVLALVVMASPAAAQTPTGSVSLFGDYFPQRQDATELRARVFVEETFAPSPRLSIDLSGFAEGMVARRATAGRVGRVTDGILSVQQASVTFSGERLDLSAGFARVAWGKLDEIQPTDVVNPLDVSRFFFEGRSEARLPVLLVRGRFHAGEAVTVEGVYIPDFRRGRFDRLDEDSSPFNLPLVLASDPIACQAIGCPDVPPPVAERAPAFTAANAQAGARVSFTTARVDWSLAAFRGFESFGLYQRDGVPADPRGAPTLARIYPRFTMIGGDFEAVRGAWGLRGEIAAFVDDSFQSADLRVIAGSSVDAGLGLDRRAGDYTISATLLFHQESYESPLSRADPRDARRDVSLVASADRTFAREKYRARGFAVYNAMEDSAFLRGIGTASLRDNVAVEASIGWFIGDGRDLVGRFSDSDFVYLRLKYYF
jgi:hypothetical protein